MKYVESSSHWFDQCWMQNHSRRSINKSFRLSPFNNWPNDIKPQLRFIFSCSIVYFILTYLIKKYMCSSTWVLLWSSVNTFIMGWIPDGDKSTNDSSVTSLIQVLGEIHAEPWQSLESRLVLKKTPLKSTRGDNLNSGLKGQNQVLYVLIPFYCFAADDPNLTKKKKKGRSNLMISVISASFLRLPLQHNTQLSPSHSGLIIKF